MELKPGYKQTEVGMIPEDWEVRSLQDLCKEEITYGIVQCGPHLPSGIPYIRVSDMDGPILEREKMLCTSSQIASRFRRSEVRHGDIVYALRGRLGEVRSVTLDLDGANLTQGTARISPGLSVHSPFLLWALRNPEVVLRACAESKGTTFMEITLSDLRRIKIAIPPEPEQVRISSTLSDIEDHLMTLDLELAKRRNIKQAAMQELLTGKRRLPGFEGEWEVKRLTRVAEISAGINKPLSEMGSGCLYVTVQDLYDKTSIRTERLSRIKVLPSEIETRSLAVGDIVFGKSSVKRDGIGYPSQFLGCGEPVVFSGFTYRARARPGIADPAFLFYALRAEKTRLWLIDNSQSSALTNINQTIANSIPVSMPPLLLEQTAIAVVLFDMDAELSALESRRVKTSALKKGMMQKLLTGKIRLT